MDKHLIEDLQISLAFLCNRFERQNSEYLKDGADEMSLLEFLERIRKGETIKEMIRQAKHYFDDSCYSKERANEFRRRLKIWESIHSKKIAITYL